MSTGTDYGASVGPGLTHAQDRGVALRNANERLPGFLPDCAEASSPLRSLIAGLTDVAAVATIFLFITCTALSVVVSIFLLFLATY